MGRAEVDVAIVLYGGGNHLPACIEALRLQGDVVGRVVVIDNASPDASAKRAEALGLEVIRNPTNVGYASAMNQALRASSAPYLLALNADCTLAPGYIDACVDALRASADLAGVTGVLRLGDGRIDSTGIELSPSYVARDRDRHAMDPSSSAPFGVSGAAALWRRAALQSAGAEPWWDWLFMYWDDVELCWRLRERGWGFAVVLEAEASHRRGSDTADPDFIEGKSLRNRLATVARHAGVSGLLRPRSLVHTIATMARLALRHPQALRDARPVAAVRVGLRARRADRSTSQ